MNIINDGFELVPVGQLSEHPKNPRQGDLGQIHESIEENGFFGAILAQRSTGHVLVGNHRYRTVVQQGETQIPCIWLNVDDDRALRILLVENRTNDLASYDDAALADILKDIATTTGTLEGTGFDGDALDAILADLDQPPFQQTEGEDDVPETPEKPVSVLGDLWLLGEHRVLCGDSTDKDCTSRLCAGTVPGLMVTDPPYGVEYDPTWRDGKGGFSTAPVVQRGKVANDDQVDWSPAWKLFPGDVAYVWHAGIFAGEVAESLSREQFLVRAQIIWAKQQGVFGRGAYHWQHEPCWYVVRKGANANWKGDRTQTTLWQVQNLNPTGNREEERVGHGTQKPVELMRRPILNHTEADAYVYDPFLGSGSTLIACEKTGRRCLGMELAPEYVDVIVKRWQDFTSKEATLEGDGRTFAEVSAARGKKSKRKSA